MKRRIDRYIIEAIIFGGIVTAVAAIWLRFNKESVTPVDRKPSASSAVLFDQEINTGTTTEHVRIMWIKSPDWDVLVVLFFITYISYLMIKKYIFRRKSAKLDQNQK